MKLAEIKLEALRLMNIAGTTNLDISNFDIYLKEVKFQKYLFNMDNSINRAIDYINSREVLKTKSKKLKECLINESENYIIFDLDLIKDLYKPQMVLYYGEEAIDYLNFEVNANELILYGKFTLDNLKLVYMPKILPITNFDNNEEVLMPEEFSRILPYFIKGDLYQEDEPDLALYAKNTFESQVENLRQSQFYPQSEINLVFRSE